MSMVISCTISSSSAPLATTTSPSTVPPSLPYLTNPHHGFIRITCSPKLRTPRPSLWRISSSDSRTTVDVASPPTQLHAAADVVRSFYEGINRRDLASVEYLVAENGVYEDLIFPQPFVGRKAILDFFKKFGDIIGNELQFVIDDMSAEDSSAVGVTWHLEWKGKPFPFSKGCSFYRLEVVNGKRQIIYGRDSVEPAIKPGESALMSWGPILVDGMRPEVRDLAECQDKPIF